MDEQELRKLIEDLHAELQNTQAVDPKGEELLLQLEAEIQELLSRKDVHTVPAKPATLGNLKEGLDHFEITHPDLTVLLADLLESLSKVGI